MSHQEAHGPRSGNLRRHILDQNGLAPFRLFLARAAFDDAAAETRRRFAASYGISLKEAWVDWRGWLVE